MPRSRALVRPVTDWAVASLLLLVGQLGLIALGPLSRVGDPGAGTAGPGGVALLAPDSVGYLADASSWSGVASEAWPRWGYLGVLRLGDLVGEAALVAVVVQVIATVLAGVLLLRHGRDLAGPMAGLVAAAVLLLNPMTAQWVRFVLTEALFYALAVATTVFGARTLVPPVAGTDRRASTGPLLVLALAAVAFRPTGPLLAGAALILLMLSRPGPRWRRAVGVAVAGAGTAALLVAAALVSTPAEGPLTGQLRAGVVIEGTPDVRMTIDMPDGPEGVPAYVAAEPWAVLRLVATRVAVEVAQVRPHYPPAVNAALGTAMVGLLVLAAVGLRAPEGRLLRVPTSVVLVPLVGIVGVTFGVPEGRYGWAGLVALAPAVGVGAAVASRSLRARSGTPAAR